MGESLVVKKFSIIIIPSMASGVGVSPRSSQASSRVQVYTGVHSKSSRFLDRSFQNDWVIIPSNMVSTFELGSLNILNDIAAF